MVLSRCRSKLNYKQNIYYTSPSILLETVFTVIASIPLQCNIIDHRPENATSPATNKQSLSSFVIVSFYYNKYYLFSVTTIKNLIKIGSFTKKLHSEWMGNYRLPSSSIHPPSDLCNFSFGRQDFVVGRRNYNSNTFSINYSLHFSSSYKSNFSHSLYLQIHFYTYSLVITSQSIGKTN